MRLGLFAAAITLTLVVVSARAATRPGDPDLPTDETPNTDDTSRNGAQLQMMDVAQPPEKKAQRKVFNEVFFPYQSSISPRAGTGLKNFGNSSFYVIGLNYMLDSATSKHLEIGVDLTAEASGLLHLGEKWVYNRNSAFRPYFKVGPSVKLIPDQQLGTFLKPENYELRLAGGFEKLVRIPMSLRLDFEIALASGGYGALVALGYSWAW